MLQTERLLRLIHDARTNNASPSGDKVFKPNGYRFDSTIVAVFKNLKGEIRIVAENRDGILHIFNEKQLQLRT